MQTIVGQKGTATITALEVGKPFQLHRPVAATLAGREGPLVEVSGFLCEMRPTITQKMFAVNFGDQETLYWQEHVAIAMAKIASGGVA